MLGQLTLAEPEELAGWHKAYMAEIVLPHILPGARELIAQHRDRGDLCAIVTATNEFVTRPIAAEFGITDLIATIPEQNHKGYTGRILGTPSFKERSDEHTSELKSLMRISYAVFCLKKKK